MLFDPASYEGALTLEQTIDEVWPLQLLNLRDRDQMLVLYRLLHKLPHVVSHYLDSFIFPETCAHQGLKLSACGQELGGDFLFDRRLGFSGTPSDLLPVELGRCQYERGADGKMLHALTNPSVLSVRRVAPGWTVEGLLQMVADPSKKYRALIDTGALVTGLTNYQVARFLLTHGLDGLDGVVFLDEKDRKVILVRDGLAVLPLAQCGIDKGKRFSFYDQVHTTGMDIKQGLDAKAALTLGKDMTFRDYAQGAFRMRGIGAGQTVELVVVPEVLELVHTHLAAGLGLSGGPKEHKQRVHEPLGPEPVQEQASAMEAAAAAAGGAVAAGASSAVSSQSSPSSSSLQRDAQLLKDVAAWLVVNQMRSEKVQFNLLCEQNVCNVWRKRAFQSMVHSRSSVGKPATDIRRLAVENGGNGNNSVAVEEQLALCMDAFRERIDFEVWSVFVCD